MLTNNDKRYINSQTFLIMVMQLVYFLILFLIIVMED